MFEVVKNLILILFNVVVTGLVLGGMSLVVVGLENYGLNDYPYFYPAVASVANLVIAFQVLKVSYKYIYKPLKLSFC